MTPERDAKLAALKALITKKVRQPPTTKDGRLNRKVLVFPASADTAKYLYDQLAEWAQTDLEICTALVTGSGDNRTTYQPGGYPSLLAEIKERVRSAQVRAHLAASGEMILAYWQTGQSIVSR